MRGVTLRLRPRSSSSRFLLTRPMRGVTLQQGNGGRQRRISTHTPHAGRDQQTLTICGIRCQFLLTRPMRGVTGIAGKPAVQSQFLLTRPMRGVTSPHAESFTEH